MPSPTPEVTFKDRSVHEIHLENGYTYVIEQNLKHFSSVINVLAKFSEQILLQPSDDSLVMSASSSARSAYAKVKLCRPFFDRLRARENLAADGEVFCRLATKSLVHIFRSASHSSVGPIPSCSLELDPQSDFAYVHLQCVSSIRRCFVLSLREHAMVCDNVFNERQRLKNRVTAHAKMLAGLLGPLDCSDLELCALPERFTACRYITREDYGKVRRTEVQIPVDHCEQYRIDVPTRVVVNLRELRPILQFADICGMSVTLHFDRAGRPLIVAVEENVDFAAEFVLGTLDELLPIHELQQPQQQQKQQQQLNRNDTPQGQLLVRPEQLNHNDPPLSQGQLLARPEQLNDPPLSQGQLLARPEQLSHNDPPLSQGLRPEQLNDTPLSQGQLLARPEQLSHNDPPLSQGLRPEQLNHNDPPLSQGLRPEHLNHNDPQLSQGLRPEHLNHNDTPLSQGQLLARPEQLNHNDPPLSQGQLLVRPVPILEFVDPNEIPLERYMLSEQLSAVPRPEGMSVWEQDSDVGSRVVDRKF